MNKHFSWKEFMEDLTQEKNELNIAPTQPSESHRKKVVQSHIDSINDKSKNGPTFAKDFKGEDPVGTQTFSIGGNDFKDMFNVPFTLQKAELISPITTSFGNSAAMAFKLNINVNGKNLAIDIIDVFEFNEEGEVIELKAYWGKENVTLLD